LAGRIVRVGASADNVLNGSAPPQLTRELLEARLQSELRRKSPPAISESEVSRDWSLLQQALGDGESSLTAVSTFRAESISQDRP